LVSVRWHKQHAIPKQDLPPDPRFLQICFASALREAGLRRQLFANALALCRETRGRGIVVSSGARSYMELRGPLDVVNLATLFGLTQQQALAAVTSGPAAVVQRAVARRAYRSTLTLRTRTAEELAAVRRQEQEQRKEQQQQKGNQQADAAQQGAAMQVDAQPLSFAARAGR
jgi:ribonuclease P/MRP protein subunit RPP1